LCAFLYSFQSNHFPSGLRFLCGASLLEFFGHLGRLVFGRWMGSGDTWAGALVEHLACQGLKSRSLRSLLRITLDAAWKINFGQQTQTHSAYAFSSCDGFHPGVNRHGRVPTLHCGTLSLPCVHMAQLRATFARCISSGQSGT
jgi:hypothetical protein